MKVTGFLHAIDNAYSEKGLTFYVLPYKSDASDVFGVPIGEVEFDHKIPDNLLIADEIVRWKIAALEAERQKAVTQYFQTLQRINERLAKLQALTNDPKPEADGFLHLSQLPPDDPAYRPMDDNRSGGAA
jgi:hypothetical protein